MAIEIMYLRNLLENMSFGEKPDTLHEFFSVTVPASRSTKPPETELSLSLWSSQVDCRDEFLGVPVSS